MFSELPRHLPAPVYYLVPMAVMAVGVVYWLLGRRFAARLIGPGGVSALRAFLLPFLMAAAALAMINYMYFFNWRFNNFLNAYEFYHYYLGSKYAEEVRYTDLYNASVVAQAELYGKKNLPGTVRNLETGVRGLKTAEVLERADEIKGRFSPERWEEWRTDTAWFKSRLTGGRWNGMLSDKGYNAPPVWSAAVGGLLTNRIPTGSTAGMYFIASLDLVLISIAFLAVAWAFGLRTALFMLLLLGTHYVMKFSHMKGALLRTDFAVSLVLSVCMAKKQRYAASGVFLAWSVLSRVFPATFLFGFGAKAVWDLAATRRIPWRFVRFFAAFGVTVAGLVGYSVVYAGGTHLWEDFAAKIAMHNTQVSGWRVGFKYLFMARWPEPKPPAPVRAPAAALKPGQTPDTGAATAAAAAAKPWRTQMDDWFKARKVYFQSKIYNEHRTLWWAIQLCMLGISFFLVRGLRDHDALIFGFVPCFFLAAPTYYYYIMLLVPLLFFAPHLERLPRLIGFELMFFTAMAGYYFNEQLRFGQEFVTYFWMSVLIGATVLWMAVVAAGVSINQVRRERRARRARKPAQEVPDHVESPATA